MSDQPLKRGEAQDIARQAAEETVSNLFRTLGVDVTNQKDLNDLRADLDHSRKIRQASTRSARHALMIFVGAVVLGALKLIWDGVFP